MRNSFQFLVERKLNPVGRSGKDIIYLCPKCDDKSGHLYINFDRNVFHCVRCDYGGRSITTLLIDLGMDVRFDYTSLESNYDKDLSTIISQEEKSTEKTLVDYSRNLNILTEYYYQHVKELSKEARKYLNNRGISDSIIHKLHICEGISRYKETFNIRNKTIEGRDYSGRIMIPSLYKEGLISYYVGRDYIGTKYNKYVNPNQELAYSSEDVWNLHNIDSQHVIICEGILSAISAGGIKQNACATYGKTIASRSNSDNPLLIVKSQGEKLLERKFKSYYVAYDADAYKNSLQTARYLHERGANVKVVRIDPSVYGKHADANDIGYNKFLELLSEAKTYDKFMELGLD